MDPGVASSGYACVTQPAGVRPVEAMFPKNTNEFIARFGLNESTMTYDSRIRHTTGPGKEEFWMSVTTWRCERSSIVRIGCASDRPKEARRLFYHSLFSLDEYRRRRRRRSMEKNFAMGGGGGAPSDAGPHDDPSDKGGDAQQLCASCDRCRSRKTKCDGKRPCSNCIFKFLKKNKLERYVFHRRSAI